MPNATPNGLYKQLVSVIIVNYNAGDFLSTCVQSVLGQADEIIIVDNASTDMSLDLCAQNFTDGIRPIIIKNPINLGFAAACNIGARTAKGEHLFFLNPDCRLEPQAVGKLAHALQQDASVGMAGGLLVNPDGSEQEGARRAIPTPWRSFVRVLSLHRLSGRWPGLFFDFHLHNQPLPAGPVAVEAISGACMLVKREAMEEVGAWDEAYFLHCEDLDWCMRFRQKGWQILFVPDALITHALGVCSSIRPLFVEWHKHKGMVRFYHKFFRHQYPGALMWLVVLGVWGRFGLIALGGLIKRITQGFGGRNG